MRVQFFDGTGWKLISPDQVIRSVPFAGFAGVADSATKLGNKTANDFILKSTLPAACSGTEVLSFNGTNFVCVIDQGGMGSTGTVTSVAAGTGLTGGPITTSGTLNVDVGVTTGKILQVAAGNRLPIIDGSNLTNLTFSQMTGTLPIANGGTGQTTADAALNALLPAQSSGALLKSNGSTTSFALLRSTDIKSNSSGNPSFFNLSGACPAGEMITYSAVTDQLSCAAYTLPSSVSGNLWSGSSGNVYRTAGRVGIGTNAPYAMLEINGTSANMFLTDADGTKGSNIDSNIVFKDQYNVSVADIGFQGTRDLLIRNDDQGINFSTGGTANRLFVRADGNVGIGTNSPTEKLEVAGKVKATEFCIDASCISAWPGAGSASWSESSGNAFRATGRVGIGNNNPGTTLDVTGIARVGSAVTVKDTDHTSLAVGAPNGTYSGIEMNGNRGSGDVLSTYLNFFNGTSQIAAINAFTGTNTTSGAITFDTSVSGSPTEKMRIDQLGNVGIGVTAPLRKLHVNGPIRVVASAAPSTPAAGDMYVDSGDNNILKWYDGSVWKNAGPSADTLTVAKGGTGATSFDANKLVAINSTGSALISWSCPVGNLIKFDSAGVAGCDTVANILGYTPANGSNYVAKAGDTMTGALAVVSPATGSVVTGRFASNPGGAGAGNLNALVLDNTNGASNYKNEIKFRGSGNDKWTIGIDPAGAGEQTFYIWDAVANARRMSIDGYGNIGIGTDSPSYKLHVNGSSASTANTTVASSFNFLYAGPSASSATRFIANISGTETGSATAAVTGEILGQASYAKHISANALSKLSGSWSGIYHTTSGTVATGIAAQGEVNNDGTGTLSQAIGFHSSVKNNSSGTITNGYGVYVDAVQATNKWSIYANDSTAPSYFAGRVGIGTTAPVVKLDVAGDIKSTGTSATVSIDATSANPNLRFMTNGTNRADIWYDTTGPGTINISNVGGANMGWSYQVSTGNIGIGTVSPNNRLTNYSANITNASGIGLSGPNTFSWSHPESGDFGYAAAIQNSGTTTGNNGLLVRTNNVTSSEFILTATSGSTDRFVVRADGNVGIGTTSPGEKLTVYNGSTTGTYSTSGWGHSSDVRLKKDIQPLVSSLDKILQLQGVEYKFKSDADEKNQIGFIAQQVEPVFPEVVITGKDGFKSMVYSNLVAPLVESVKEIHGKILVLFERSENQARGIASLESEVQDLKKENRMLKSYLCEKDPKAAFCGKK